MDAKKLVTGAVVGTVAQAIFGFLIFDLLFASFYEANMTVSADLMREGFLLWPMVLGNLALAILVTLAVDRTGSGSLPGGRIPPTAGADAGLRLVLRWCSSPDNTG